MALFKRTYGFPKQVKGMWLAGVRCMNEDIDHNTKLKVIMPYFDNHKYVEHREGDTVPVFENNGRKAYYKITGWSRYLGSDPAPFDDKREYDLAFHHTEVTTAVSPDPETNTKLGKNALES